MLSDGTATPPPASRPSGMIRASTPMAGILTRTGTDLGSGPPGTCPAAAATPRAAAVTLLVAWPAAPAAATSGAVPR